MQIKAGFLVIFTVFASLMSSMPAAADSQEKLNQELYAAVGAGDVAKIKALIAVGANVNDARGGFVEEQVQFFNLDVTPVKIKKGLIIAETKATATQRIIARRIDEHVLALAAREGKLEIIKVLLDAGADVNARNILSQTALMVAALGGQGDAVQMLVAAKADVNLVEKDGKTALMLAAENGQTDAVRALLKGNADVDIASKNGQTAMSLAVTNSHLDMSRRMEVARLLADPKAVTHARVEMDK